TLKEVVGAPTDEEIKSVQGVARSLENLANSPQLFDANLSIMLSQHMFNLQFARYMQDSAEGKFVSKTELGGPRSAIPPTQETRDTSSKKILDSEGEAQNIPLAPDAEQAPEVPSELAQLGETIVKAIKDATKETKDVLENTNRMLMLIKRDQSTVGGMDKYYHIYKDPLNQQGMAASVSNIIEYYNGMNGRMIGSEQIAGYLKFFGIGADLIQGDKEPKLIDGKADEAKKLLLAHAGFAYY
ncbi:hypothetical protein FRC11_012934, partial [Ceratobasidium sp. 423]